MICDVCWCKYNIFLLQKPTHTFKPTHNILMLSCRTPKCYCLFVCLFVFILIHALCVTHSFICRNKASPTLSTKSQIPCMGFDHMVVFVLFIVVVMLVLARHCDLEVIRNTTAQSQRLSDRAVSLVCALEQKQTNEERRRRKKEEGEEEVD